MTLFERFLRSAGPSQFARHLLGEQFPKRRHFVAFGPRHLRAGAVMCEIFQPQIESIELVVVAQDVAKRLKLLGLAVGGEPHHFVFITEFQEAQILRDRRIVQSQRMGKGDGPVNFHSVAYPEAAHRAGKVTKAVGRQ